jgi:hypothetical protein
MIFPARRLRVSAVIDIPPFGLRTECFQFATNSRRRRFNSLTGSITSPARKFFSSPSLNGVPPSRPSCSRNFSAVSGTFSAFASGMADSALNDIARFIPRDERQRFGRRKPWTSISTGR